LEGLGCLKNLVGGDATIASVTHLGFEDIAAYGRKHATDDFKWRACLLPCQLVFEKGNHPIPVIGRFSSTRMPKIVPTGLHISN